MSQVFVVARGVNPEYAFGTFVRSGHPQEAFGAIRCGYPQAQPLAESARQDDIKSQQSISEMKIFDVNWKPAQ